jgi:hypothetical protein
MLDQRDEFVEAEMGNRPLPTHPDVALALRLERHVEVAQIARCRVVVDPSRGRQQGQRIECGGARVLVGVRGFDQHPQRCRVTVVDPREDKRQILGDGVPDQPKDPLAVGGDGAERAERACLADLRNQVNAACAAERNRKPA